MPKEENTSPCLNCGACCTCFRVSFYWAEADDAPDGYVPTSLTEQISLLMRAMRGTHPFPHRCIALQGSAGQSVFCSIYAKRPTPCRDFPVWLADGHTNQDCNKARAKIGLPPVPDLESLMPGN